MGYAKFVQHNLIKANKLLCTPVVSSGNEGSLCFPFTIFIINIIPVEAKKDCLLPNAAIGRNAHSMGDIPRVAERSETHLPNRKRYRNV